MNYSSCLHQWIKVISPNIVNDLYPFEEILWNEKKFLGQGLKEFPPPTPLLHFRNQCACRSTSYILVQAWSIKFADSHLIQCKVRCSSAATVFIYIVVLKFKLTLSRNDHYFIINLTWISTGLSLFVLFFSFFFFKLHSNTCDYLYKLIWIIYLPVYNCSDSSQWVHCYVSASWPDSHWYQSHNCFPSHWDVLKLGYLTLSK